MNVPDDRSLPEPRTGQTAAGRGPRLGPIRLTPLRATLGIGLFIAFVVVGYGFEIRDASQLPILTAGELISAIVFGALAAAGAYAAYRHAAEGRTGRALVYALFGGIAAVIAAASLAAAVILGLVIGE